MINNAHNNNSKLLLLIIIYPTRYSTNAVLTLSLQPRTANVKRRKKIANLRTKYQYVN